MANFYGRPSSSFGYWRGSVDPGIAGPSGDGDGGSKKMPSASGISSMFTTGQGSGGGWNPTIVYLLILIVAEMIVFGFISKMLR